MFKQAKGQAKFAKNRQRPEKGKKMEWNKGK